MYPFISTFPLEFLALSIFWGYGVVIYTAVSHEAGATVLYLFVPRAIIQRDQTRGFAVYFSIWMIWSLRGYLLLNTRKIVTLAWGPTWHHSYICYWLEVNAGQSGCKRAPLIIKFSLQNQLLQES